MDFVNLNAPAATAADFARVAEMLGCEPAALRAVWRVESRGRSYDDRGRLAMLFEPHHFYRLTKGQARRAAVAAGIAYPKWRKGYPSDSYPRLMRAIEIAGEEIACNAASWGGPQIMGFNHKLVGYDGAVGMVAAFLASEGAQVEAFGQFVKASGLADELRRKDWAGFARGYNGPAYAKNAYDKKLAQAYAHFKVQKPMAVMIAPLPGGPLPAAQRAETVPALSRNWRVG